MTSREIVLGVLAGQSPGYKILPSASAFQAAGFSDAAVVAALLSELAAERLVAAQKDGWTITTAGRAAAPLEDGTVPPPAHPPTTAERVYIALDALDAKTASVGDVIAAVKSALKG